MEERIRQILLARKSSSDTLNVMDVLGLEADQLQLAFNIALEMENRNLVKLLYSNFNTRQVVVEFTLLGKSGIAGSSNG